MRPSEKERGPRAALPPPTSVYHTTYLSRQAPFPLFGELECWGRGSTAHRAQQAAVTECSCSGPKLSSSSGASSLTLAARRRYPPVRSTAATRRAEAAVAQGADGDEGREELLQRHGRAKRRA